MNDRIRELAEQAGLVIEVDEDEDASGVFDEAVEYIYDSYDIDLKKFAELIIRECAYRIDDLVTSDDDGNQILECDDVKTELLEHFGVEQ